MKYLDRHGFARLVASLAEAGYDVIGPTVRDGAIVLDHIDGADELPAGVSEEQGPGVYRLGRTALIRIAWTVPRRRHAATAAGATCVQRPFPRP